ncbi:hypothetical protein ABID22_001031 [Pontibacter aydingkolensis]|uniref:DUF4136 domain-containing protein n=1 Tax=Pontibacter aydingkolensis TaxID=1911536 RepID=A0ABS7CSX8_9BACT|nr:DUF4136 domain-containing protein [Pontibacter aydingkolensis]MBW7466941.1 DUF4136 domain-containing protein [Pontibacter aydingkolensis]
MVFYKQLPFIRVKATVILLLILFCTSCSPAVSVQSAYDPSINFSTYQTFAWHPAEVPAPKQGTGGALYSTLLDQRVKEAIASELVKNGIKPSIDNPGLLVAYDIAVETPQELNNTNILQPGFGYGYSYWYGYRYRYSGTGLQNFRSIADYKIGTLVIDLIDRNTNNVVWRGAFDAEIDPVIIDEDKINRAVANLMSQFPPVPRTSR